MAIVYADKLTFGTGTSLTVIPKGNNRMPVLSILQTKDLTLSVCLATGFFPRTSPMELTVAKTGEGGEKKQSIPTDNAALSSSKTYFFAGFSKNGEPIETCSLNGTETTTAPQTEEDDPPVTESIVHSPVEDCKPINDTILDSGGSPKVNFICSFLEMLENMVLSFVRRDKWMGQCLLKQLFYPNHVTICLQCIAPLLCIYLCCSCIYISLECVQNM
ncbi:hypothetical protein GJAV_G00112190 [Gymnothorax javanicus]|nr:hypothetical protein GJAV_G00112190 [Gymnothorax javanicus]